MRSKTLGEDIGCICNSQKALSNSILTNQQDSHSVKKKTREKTYQGTYKAIPKVDKTK